MSDVQTGGNAGSESNTPWSAREAAAALTEEQNAPSEKAPAKEPVKQPQSAPEAPAADESADEADANPDEGHGETQEVEAAAEPPIEPPVSWTTAEKERWQSIPRETQEYITQREMARESLLTQKSKEAEEQLKGLSAREQALEQQRLQFEAINRAQLQEYQDHLQSEYRDIQNQADVDKMSVEDPVRWIKWMTHQQKMASKVAVEREAQDRQAQQAQAQFAKFAEEQDKAFIQRMPEFADGEKAEKLKKSARTTLKNVGFPDDELSQLWNGQKNFSFREARMQELIAKAARWDEAQEAKKSVVANKSLPPVQRPGVAQQGNSISNQIRDLEKLSRKSSGKAQLDIEAKIMALEQRARARQ